MGCETEDQVRNPQGHKPAMPRSGTHRLRARDRRPAIRLRSDRPECEVAVRGNDTYQILIDPDASPDSARPRFQVPAGASLEDVANALDLIFRADSQCDAVLLMAAGHAAGVVTRARFQTLISPSGPHRGESQSGPGTARHSPGRLSATRCSPTGATAAARWCTG